MNEILKTEIARVQLQVEALDINPDIKRWLTLNFEICAEFGYLEGQRAQLLRDEKKFYEIMNDEYFSKRWKAF